MDEEKRALEQERLSSAAELAWTGLVDMRRLLERDRQWRSLAVFSFLRKRVLPTLRTVLRDPRRQRELDHGSALLWSGDLPVRWPAQEKLDRRLEQGRSPVEFITFGDESEAGPLGHLLQELTWGAVIAEHGENESRLYACTAAQQVLAHHGRELKDLRRPAGIGPPPQLVRVGLGPTYWRPLPAWLPDLSFHFRPTRPPTVLARGGLVLAVHPLTVDLDRGEAHFPVEAHLVLEEGGPRHRSLWRPASFCFLLEKSFASREHDTRSQ